MENRDKTNRTVLRALSKEGDQTCLHPESEP